jgi:threonine dehydrogenase-like Zn-dependent dehydrogenase
MSSSDTTMQAVIFKGVRAIAVERRPILKVHVTALCGSELHVYRGHEHSEIDIIMVGLLGVV